MDEFIEIKDGEFNDHQYITSMSGGKDSKKSGKSFPRAMDVKTWALGKEPDDEDQLKLSLSEDGFEDFTGPACQSHYGLCE